MKRALPLFAAILTWCLPALAVPPTPQPGDEQLVSAAYPVTLDSGGGEKAYAFARADLNRTGNGDFVVAVYGGDHGIVRVLRPSATGTVGAAEADYPAMGGTFPRLRLVDLNGDGSPEIVASYATAAGSEETWILRWATNQLSLAGPATVAGRQAVVHSGLAMVDFFELDGDGIPEIVEFDRNGDQILKRQADGTYTRTGEQVVYVNRYERHTTEPELFTGVFQALAGQTLKVKMVFAPGSPAPPQGDLYINGQLVFDHPVFMKGCWAVEASVTAEDVNEVESMLDGPVGAAVNVVVTVDDDLIAVGIAR